MAASAWVIHDRFLEFQGDGTIDLDNDTFEVRLYTSASNINLPATGDATTATNEVTGNGYSRVVVAATWNRLAGTVTFDIVDAVFTATGGNIVARYAAIVDTTPATDEVVAHTVLDNTPADITVTDGNTLTVRTPASGALTLTAP